MKGRLMRGPDPITLLARILFAPFNLLFSGLMIAMTLILPPPRRD